MTWCSDYDRLLAEQGPATIFLRTIEGAWRCQPDLSRDGWERMESPPERDPAHGLMRDRATGFVTRVFTSSRALFHAHPRVELRWFDSEELADQALAELGSPPLVHAPWS